MVNNWRFDGPLCPSRLAVQTLRHALEVVLVGLVLELLELMEALLGDLVRRLLVAVAEALEHLAPAECQEAVEQALAVLHARKDVPLGPVLERVEQHRDEAVQLPDLVLGQVVLGHGDVRGVNAALGASLPRRESHVGLGGVGAPLDDLGRGVPGDGVVHLVLDRA